MNDTAKKYVVDEPQDRGVLSEHLAGKYEPYLGHPLTVEELRLIPYVQYCAVNWQSIDRSRVNAEEREILRDWTDRGLCQCYPFNVEVAPSQSFWRFMCDVLFDAYVLHLREVSGGEPDAN